MTSKVILVAAHQLRGGTKGKGDLVDRFTLEAGEELTSAKSKAMGLDKEAVQALVDRGALIEVSARVAESAGPADTAALKAATERAEKAEAKVKDLETEVAELKQKLEDATKPPPAA